MKSILSNTTIHYRKLFVSCIAILLVLLTSCAIKNTLKTFVGIPTNIEQTTSKGQVVFSNYNASTCLSSSESHIARPTQGMMQSNYWLPVTIALASYLFLIPFYASRKVNKHPSYTKSTRIPNSIPLFLEYRKLIVYFS